jgi:hypothetical protein
LDTLVTSIGTPLSITTLENTYIRNCLPFTSKYIKIPLGDLKPNLHNPINHPISIEHQERHLGRCLSHTKELGSMTKGMVYPILLVP